MNEPLQKVKKKPTIVSFISGKGGVGKTALTASVGKLLSLLGFKVLMLDSDLVTHGLTFLLGFDSKKCGIIELYANYVEFVKKYAKGEKTKAQKTVDEFYENFELDWICKISDNLHFFQSTSTPSRRYSSLVNADASGLRDFVHDLLKDKYLDVVGAYDFVLVDCQAGAVASTFGAVSASSKVVAVMEPDPISVYATENVVSELGEDLPRDRFMVVNKLSFEEASAYKAIEQFLKILNHLSPVPFDFEVRRAFMLRQIPINETKPSAFMFGIVRMLKDLLPQLSNELDEFEKRMEDTVIGPIKEKIAETESQLEFYVKQENRTRHSLEEITRRRETYSDTFRKLMLIVLPFIMVFYLVFYAVTRPFTAVDSTFIIALFVGFAMIGAAGYMAVIFDRRLKSKASSRLEELSEDLSMITAKRSRIERTLDSYNNLVLTRSKELFLAGGKEIHRDNENTPH